MAKQKQQVKYNPKLSAVRRADKAKYAIGGKAQYLCNAVFAGLGLLMIFFYIFFCIFDTAEEIANDTGAFLIFMCNAAFMLFFMYAFNALMPPNNKTQNNTKVDGCLFVYKLFCHLPVTKLTIVKLSYRYFAVMSTLITLISMIGNVMLLCMEKLDPVRGHIGLMTLTLAIALVVIHVSGFSAFYRKRSKAIEILLPVVLILFYVIWFGSMLNFFAPFYELPAVRALGGVPGIVIALAAYVFSWIYEKQIVEKKAAKSSWRDE